MKKIDCSRFLFDLELARINNVEWIIGLDEVGYGCFAGDIVVGAAAISVKSLESLESLIKDHPLLLKVKDSKKITEKVREEIDHFLRNVFSSEVDFYYAVGSGTVDEINNDGVTKSHNKATERAFNSLLKKNPLINSSNLIILDGNKIYECLKSKNSISVVKGDNKSFAVASASIIAKVFRDNEMKNYSKLYPHYNFHKNKGYGTKDHTDAILGHGIINLHRLKYCKNFLK
jgi:ribonuclease HII